MRRPPAPPRLRLLALAAMAVVHAHPALASCNQMPAKGVDWSGCIKTGLYLAGDAMTGARLDGATLSSTNLTGADLTNASLAKATLTATNLAGAKLVSANLSDAAGTRSNFTGADLTKARLDKAELWSALIDWSPGGGVGPLEYRGSRHLAMTRGRLWHQYDFAALNVIATL